MMRIIAEHGGLVVAEDGKNIIVIDRGNGTAEITAFVLLIVILLVKPTGIFGEKSTDKV